MVDNVDNNIESAAEKSWYTHSTIAEIRCVQSLAMLTALWFIN